MALGESLNFIIDIQDKGSSAIQSVVSALGKLTAQQAAVTAASEHASGAMQQQAQLTEQELQKLRSLGAQYTTLEKEIVAYGAATDKLVTKGKTSDADLDVRRAKLEQMKIRLEEVGSEIDKLSNKKAEPPVDIPKTEQAVQALAKLPPEIKKTEQASGQAAPKLKEAAQATEQVAQKAQQAEPALGQMAAKMAETAEKSGALHSAMSTLSSGMAVFAGNIYTQAFNGIAGGIGNIKAAMIDGNAQFEYYEGQFATLLHSTDAARQHIQDLSTFAAVTPFDLPQVVEASKNLLTFGGTALDTQATLTLVGNAAAATGQNFNEVAFWTGRAYNAMMAGKPFGEATMRLMEMGIMTGDTANKLEALQKQGVKGPELWKTFSTGIVAPTDAMDKLGKTAQGLQSTLEDTLAGLGRTIGKPLFEAQKAGLAATIDFLNSDFVNNLAASIANAIQQFLNFKSAVIQSIVTPVQQFLQYAQPLLAVIPQLGFYMQSWGQAIGTAGGAWEGLIRWFEQAATHLALLVDKYFPGTFGGLMKIAAAGAQFLQSLTPVADALGPLVQLFSQLGFYLQTGFQMGGLQGAIAFLQQWAGRMGEHINNLIAVFGDWAAKAIPPMLAKLQELGQRLFDWIGAQVPVIAAQLLQWYTAWLGWIVPLEAQLVVKLVQIALALNAWIREQAGKLAQQLLIWGQAFIAWIGPMIPPFLQAIGDLANQFFLWVGQQVGPLMAQFNAWVQPILAWIPGAVAQFLLEWPGMLDQFLTWIGQQVGPLLEAFANWMGALIGWIEPAMPGILLALAGVAAAIVIWAGETFLVLMHKFSEWGAAIVEWIAPRVPGMLAALGQMLLSIGGWILGTGLPFLIEKLLEWGKAFVEWAGKVWAGGGGNPPLSEQVGDILSKLGAWLTGTALPAIVQKLGEWISAFVKWAGDVWTGSGKGGGLQDKLGDMLSSIGTWITKTAAPAVLSKAAEIGTGIINGIAAGIGAGLESIKKAAAGAAETALNAAKSALGIKSPSTEFLAIGMNTMGAWAQGVTQTAILPVAAVAGVGQQVAATGKASIAGGLGSGGIAGGGILVDPSRIANIGTGGVIGASIDMSKVANLNGVGTINPIPVIGANGKLVAIADIGNAGTIGGIDMSTVANLGNLGTISPVPVISHDGQTLAIADLGGGGQIGGSVIGGGILIDPARIFGSTNVGGTIGGAGSLLIAGPDQTYAPGSAAAAGEGVGLRHLAGMTQAPETPEGKALIARSAETTAQIWADGVAKSPAFRALGYQLLQTMAQQLADEHNRLAAGGGTTSGPAT